MNDSISPDEFEKLRETHADVALVDVRRQEDFDADPYVMPGAIRRAPEEVESWASALPPDAFVVVYCVLGGSVSRSVTQALLQRRMHAKYVSGGIEAWKNRGGDVRPASELDE